MPFGVMESCQDDPVPLIAHCRAHACITQCHVNARLAQYGAITSARLIYRCTRASAWPNIASVGPCLSLHVSVVETN
jgi:hypothetical protein